MCRDAQTLAPEASKHRSEALREAVAAIQAPVASKFDDRGPQMAAAVWFTARFPLRPCHVAHQS